MKRFLILIIMGIGISPFIYTHGYTQDSPQGKAYQCIQDTVYFSKQESIETLLWYLRSIKKDTLLKKFQTKQDKLFIHKKNKKSFSCFYNDSIGFCYDQPPDGWLDVIPWIFRKSEKFICMKEAVILIKIEEKDDTKTIQIQAYPNLINNFSDFTEKISYYMKSTNFFEKNELERKQLKTLYESIDDSLFSSEIPELIRIKEIQKILWKNWDFINKMSVHEDLALLLGIDHFFSFDFHIMLNPKTEKDRFLFEMCFQYPETYERLQGRSEDEYEKLIELITLNIIELFEK